MSSEARIVNIHCHKSSEHDIIELVNFNINELGKSDNSLISLGIHPWKIDSNDEKQHLSLIQLHAKKSNVIAIGECGLDKLINIDLELQKKIFLEQIKIAEQLKKPLIIHCVKAFNELIEIKKEWNIKTPMIIHGYNNNKNIASQLLANGFYFSFGKALLKVESNASSIIPRIPLDRIFLETDDADVSIKTIFEAASKLLQLNELELINIVYNNFKTVFHYERP